MHIPPFPFYQPFFGCQGAKENLVQNFLCPEALTPLVVGALERTIFFRYSPI